MSSPETLRVMCPNLTCRKILAVPESARGKTVRCRGCATNIRVPGGAGAAGADAGSSGKADSKPSTNAA
jgi:hypothetical protein